MADSQRTQLSASYYGREAVIALKFVGGTIIRSILELHLGAHMLAIFLIIIGISLVVAVNASVLVPVAPAGPIMVIAGIVIILLSWCSALIEANGRQAAETSLLRVRLFTSARSSDVMQSVDNSAIVNNHKMAHMVLSDIELPGRFSFDADELPIFITKPARGRGDSNQAGQKDPPDTESHINQTERFKEPDEPGGITKSPKNSDNGEDDQIIHFEGDEQMMDEDNRQHLITPEKY